MTPVDAARLVQARKLRPRARVDLTAENIGQLDFGETTALYEACACIFFWLALLMGAGLRGMLHIRIQIGVIVGFIYRHISHERVPSSTPGWLG
jgi:hypothetical protein